MYTKVKSSAYEEALFKFRHKQLKLYTKVSDYTFAQILREDEVRRYMYRLYIKDR